MEKVALLNVCFSLSVKLKRLIFSNRTVSVLSPLKWHLLTPYSYSK